MPNELTNYQCPNCTGPLHFSEETGLLQCDYCEGTFTVEAVEAAYAQKNERAETQWSEKEDKVRAFSCPSCSAELILPYETAASCCPYCNNPTIVPGKLSGARRPDFVIPFKVSKEQALQALKNHYRGKPLLPKAFSEENHIEQIQGVYVPFWLFDARAGGSMTFSATRVHMHSTPRENITETDHFLVRRGGRMLFSRLPADASQRMPDAHMDAIEPFDFGELKPFSLSYLPGFMADRYDVEKDEAFKRVKLRCTNSFEAALNASASGYSTCVPTQKELSVVPEDVKYAMLPVWMLATQWNGKRFLFALNGQTGKLIGDLPIDRKRLFSICGGVGLGVSLLTLLLLL